MVCLPQAKQLDMRGELGDYRPFKCVTLVLEAVKTAKLHYVLLEEKIKNERLSLELQGAASTQPEVRPT